MQESVNKAVESISATMGDDAVSAREGRREKIEQRKANAMARAECAKSRQRVRSWNCVKQSPSPRQTPSSPNSVRSWGSPRRYASPRL